MLNVFALTEAINGKSAFIDVGHIEAYPFYGSVTESAAQINCEILMEAADISQFVSMSDEIMVEAALTNQGAIGTLVEGVFDTLKDKVIKFFEKLIAMAKGMRDRIKAFFYKLIGRTDKWLSVMKPRIETARRNSGISDIEYEMHDWNIEFVTKDFLAAYNDLITNYAEKDSVISRMVSPEEVEKHLKHLSDRVVARNDADPESEATKNFATAGANVVKKDEASLKEAKEKFPGQLAKKFGVSANSSMEAMWQDVIKKAKGGTTEKRTVKFYNNIDKMLKALEDNRDGLKDMQKAYEDHIKGLAEKRKEIESLFSKFEISENTAPTEIVNAAKACMNSYVNNVTSLYSMVEGAGSTACGHNTRFMKEMASEFMGALTKLANSKSKKPD